jgi:hypothetical protein
MRHLDIVLIEGRHWTVVDTPRDDYRRLISAVPTKMKIFFETLVHSSPHDAREP